MEIKEIRKSIYEKGIQLLEEEGEFIEWVNGTFLFRIGDYLVFYKEGKIKIFEIDMSEMKIKEVEK